MHRSKLAAVFTLMLFLVGTFAVVLPVQATFTLGQLTGTYPYHELDFDPHVSGVIGYVWPGGGENSYSGAPNFASNTLYPGYQAPYPCTVAGQPTGNGGIVGTSGNPAQCNPPGAPTSSWYQLQGSAYAPFGSVLAGSTGDLIFAVNATATSNPGGCKTNTGGSCRQSAAGAVANDGDKLGWSQLLILLPPGFNMPSETSSTYGITSDASDVITTMTNSYTDIQVSKYFPSDRYAPDWTAVQITTDGGQSAVNNGGNNVNTAVSYYNHQFINFTSAGEWYYVRINGVTAPSIAGRYFFKIELIGDSNYLGGPEGTSPNATASYNGEATTQFIPTQNWPVLLVKGE